MFLLQVLLLFPFLEVDQSSWRQWTIKQLTRVATPLAAVAGAIGYLPNGLKRSMLKLYGGEAQLKEAALAVTFHHARSKEYLICECFMQET